MQWGNVYEIKFAQPILSGGIQRAPYTNDPPQGLGCGPVFDPIRIAATDCADALRRYKEIPMPEWREITSVSKVLEGIQY